MKRGPAAGSSASGATFAEKARARWGEAPPDWIMELAALADRQGLRAAGERVGYSGSALSMVLSGRYAGDLGRIEEAVRGALMGLVVACPALGEIGRDACLSWQKKPFAASSSIRVAVWRACRSGCPHARAPGGGPGAEGDA